MNTLEIMNKCQTLPGVTARAGENYNELLLSCEDGEGRMRFFSLFPGVTFALINVSAPSWPAPSFSEGGAEENSPLLINYCLRGRCELVLNDSKSVFLTSGQISLTERFAQNEYVYPGRLYEGIELFIDPEVVRAGVPSLRDTFGIDVAELKARYCPRGDTFIAEMSLPAHVASRFSGADSEMTTEKLVGIKTGVIDLLAELLYGKQQLSPKPPVYYTRSQVEIAKRTEKIISENLAVQHTVREFAELFSISESSVKNYFGGVFGQSISQYVTHRRMLRAAELLSGTRLPVLEVANSVGYENQSKFAAAFRRVHGCSPIEYRRNKNIEAE